MLLHDPSQGRGGHLTCPRFRTYVMHMLRCKRKCISANWTVIIWSQVPLNWLKTRRSVLSVSGRTHGPVQPLITWRLSKKMYINMIKWQRGSTRGTRDLILGRFTHDTIFHAWILWKINTVEKPPHMRWGFVKITSIQHTLYYYI